MNYPALQFPDRRSGTLPITSITASPTSPKNTSDIDLINALAIVVRSARAQGQSLADLQSEILADDVLLEPSQRRVLSEVVAQAWEQFLI
jgi:hypothetical protein